ncbi:hypothetical protein [Micromonospora echinofusca]|uniref:MYXO-CTERM domain-containing protein n=1 Tax=Micromonospora echinofusca TaxID=47858 RepID=A0ABS3VPT3_MICEH|nr:hypothetical protein [Micromonospora echinofusca]MBO4206501.1 hypothetical protein [Micromonospora echinofusca]
MSYRRKAGKPRLALWMLVALGDVALLLASGGLLAMIALVGIVTVAVAAAGGWLLRRRNAPVRGGATVPVRVRGRNIAS